MVSGNWGLETGFGGGKGDVVEVLGMGRDGEGDVSQDTKFDHGPAVPKYGPKWTKPSLDAMVPKTRRQGSKAATPRPNGSDAKTRRFQSSRVRDQMTNLVHSQVQVQFTTCG